MSVEVKRIQTYLFAVPSLRTMLGANALLGEVVRIRLPALAKEHHSELPSGFEPPEPLKPCCDVLPNKADQPWLGDCPADAWGDGVLGRDGGRFQALFCSLDNAKAFATAAGDLVDRCLPGVMALRKVEEWKKPDGQSLARWQVVEQAGASTLVDLFEMPDARPCEKSGQGSGSRSIKEGNQEVWVSPLVEGQWYAGRRFQDGCSDDVVGLLQRQRDEHGTPLLPCYGKGWTQAQDLEKLAGDKGRYLALVHMDGNGVGARKPKLPESLPDLNAWLNAEAEIEAFFASMRRSVRSALVVALKEIFGGLPSPGIRPYQLLMVGGDDVLLVCRAKHALPFVCAYARALRDGDKLSDGAPLDIGAGVAIAQQSFPFHALHALAEELASSAKRLSRGCPGHSVVDWMVVTQSSAAQPDIHRFRHDRVSYSVSEGGATTIETQLANARPYFVLNDSSRDAKFKSPSLESLLVLTEKLSRSDEVARSQLKQLPAALRKGKRAGQLAFRALPGGITELLKGSVLGLSDPWRSLAAPPSAVANVKTTLELTHLVDVIELTEIPNLGRPVSESTGPAGAADMASAPMPAPEAAA